MLRKIRICFLCLFILTSCLSYKNEYGQKRFKHNRFTIKHNTNNDVYKIIDTTKLYKIILSENLRNHQKLDIVNPIFLKFYKRGKVGEFQNYNDKDVTSLNPKKARMAVYNYDNNKLTIQLYFKNPQGGGLVKTEYIVKQNQDTLELRTEDYLEKYKIIDLPKAFLIYKPDW